MSFRHPPPIEASLKALSDDLLRPGGPQISTVRNYNFAILPYPPEDEFALRRAVHDLAGKLRDSGWTIGSVVLHSLLLARLKAEDPALLASLIAREKGLALVGDRTRGLRMLKEKLVNLLDRPDGLATDVVREIDRVVAESENPDRTVVFLGRMGALYPFLRTSSLLKNVAGRTHNVPVVLLYPGRVASETGLSFMGVLPADRDYRPRIYR